jgi:hypothetical protein
LFGVLNSINDRLGGFPGESFEPMGDEWVLDCYQAAVDESEAIEAIKSKRR